MHAQATPTLNLRRSRRTSGSSSWTSVRIVATLRRSNGSPFARRSFWTRYLREGLSRPMPRRSGGQRRRPGGRRIRGQHRRPSASRGSRHVGRAVTTDYLSHQPCGRWRASVLAWMGEPRPLSATSPRVALGRGQCWRRAPATVPHCTRCLGGHRRSARTPVGFPHAHDQDVPHARATRAWARAFAHIQCAPPAQLSKLKTAT